MVTLGDDSVKRIGIALKGLALGICILGALSGKYPPAHAQLSTGETIEMPKNFAISPYDPEFKADISALNIHLDKIDELSHRNEKSNAEIQTQMRDYFWLLAAVMGGQIVIPELRKRKKEANG